MKTCLLLTALLSGPPAHGDTTEKPDTTPATAPTSTVTLRLVDDAEAARAAAKNAGTKSRLATRDELRTIYRDLLIKTSRRKQPDPYQFSEPLVALHRAIADCQRMSNAEKKRMHRSVEGRLEQLLVLLKRDVRRTKTNAARTKSTASTKPSLRQPKTDKPSLPDAPSLPDRTSLPGGAGVARGAAELINLIQSTIAPESWDVNGGKGSIMFYSRLNVLVIRNTSEVHRTIGSGLTALRSMQPPMVTVTTGVQTVRD